MGEGDNSCLGGVMAHYPSLLKGRFLTAEKLENLGRQKRNFRYVGWLPDKLPGVTFSSGLRRAGSQGLSFQSLAVDLGES